MTSKASEPASSLGGAPPPPPPRPGPRRGAAPPPHDAGCYFFDTVKPGVCDPNHAPHIAVTVFARGMLSHLFTRLHFSDEAAANAQDPVLASVPADRRDTLIAQRAEVPGGVVYRFDIRLQGAGETVFFDC